MKKHPLSHQGANKGAIYKQTPEPSSILFKIILGYPGIKQNIADEIMSWVEYRGALHPAEVQHLLNQMANVPKGTASIILQKVAKDGDAEDHFFQW